MSMDETILKEKEKIIEAVLFAAGHPISYEKLSEVLELSVKETEALAKEFAQRYNSEDRGIMMLTFASGCQLCTREEYLPYIKEALGIKRGGNLSASSLEVLAIIAYNEPVTRSYVDTVRGVDSSYAMGSLSDKNLIEPCGRLDVPGRPILYRTTTTFLRCFGIESLEQLPYVDVQKTPMQEGEIIPIDPDLLQPKSKNDGDGAETDQGEATPTDNTEA